MKRDNQLKVLYRESRIVEPNDLGFPLLTHLYRKINRFFKTAPFIIVVPVTLIVSAMLVYMFGSFIVKAVNMLQYGF